MVLYALPNPNKPRHSQQQEVVPLKQLTVEARIRSFAADVTITQIFRNEEQTPIEAVYCFPIEEQAAIYSFQAQIDDRQVVAELKEKKEAQKEYSNALQSGHGAYLLEQDEKSTDNFIINVGALPPSKECTIKIAYVTELQYFQGSIIQFIVPTTIAPRYSSEKGGLSGPAGTTSKYVQTAPYTIDLRCHIDKMGYHDDAYIARINSESHPIQIDFGQRDAYLVTFTQQNTHLDRDILINIELSSKRTNSITAVEPGAIMAVFTPTIEDCRRTSNEQLQNEFIFVIDCSGSMQDESKIELARQSMSLFLKSLPLGCHFNIIRFGSTHKSLFHNITEVYEEKTVQQAEKLVKEMKADLGGTELYAPLHWVKQSPPSVNRARQIFLLTDGEISDVTRVLDLCRSMAESTRIFSFGLGHSPSRSLVKGLARATNGRFVFIPPKSKVDVYVGEQLQRALQPSIVHTHVVWNVGINVNTAPNKLPPVYANDRLIVYALANDKNLPFNPESNVELRLQSNSHLVALAQINQIPIMAENQTLARLAAKALILELQHEKDPSVDVTKQCTGSAQPRFTNLKTESNDVKKPNENEEQRKKKIIELSLKYNILSHHTAFVGIERRIGGDNSSMVLREVPIEVSTDDRQLIQQQRRPLSSGFMPLNCAPRRSFAHASVGFTRGSVDSARATPRKMNTVMPQSSLMMFEPAAVCDLFSCDRVSELMDDHDSTSTFALERKTSWPQKDDDQVRYLIDQQKFDGLWDSDEKLVKHLTGKPLSSFQALSGGIDLKILMTVIVVISLEKKYAIHSSLWFGVVQKARSRIETLLNNSTEQTKTLFETILKHF